MLREHEEGRALIAAMQQGADRVASARAYVELLRAHISKENNVLFELADAVLAETTKAALAQKFAAVAADLGRDASLPHAAAEVLALEQALAALPRA
jgi:hemerythrin-like domain-containing protein